MKTYNSIEQLKEQARLGDMNARKHLKKMYQIQQAKKKQKMKRMISIGICVALIFIISGIATHNSSSNNKGENTPVHIIQTSSASPEESTGEELEEGQVDLASIQTPSWIDEQLLPINEFSRPAIAIEKVNDIAIHYVGNPGTTAQQNRDYFASLATTKDRSASSHFVIGLNGEIIQCIPLNEKSYATNHRNFDTISIEVCHPGEDGKFNEKTYKSLIKLTAWLCEQLELTNDNVIRHYDVTGKICPKYYVDHPDAWEQLKDDVGQYMKENPNIK